MTLKKVDLVHYFGGERRVIGEAYIDLDGSYLDVTAKITDPSYQYIGEIDPQHLSIGFKPKKNDDGFEPDELAHIPALKKVTDKLRRGRHGFQ